MVSESEMLALADGLASNEVDVRRSSAKELLQHAREIEEVDPAYAAMDSALSDPDPDVRGTVALALLHDQWHWDDLKSLLMVIAPNDTLEPNEVDAWADAARIRANRRACAEALLPGVLRRGDPTTQAFFEALHAVSGTGVDISGASSCLSDALNGPSEIHATIAASAFANHVGHHPSADAVVKSLKGTLNGPFGMARLVSARALALHHVHNGELEEALALLEMPEVEVREGVLEAFGKVSVMQLGNQRSVVLISSCLGDSAGGVCFKSMQLLRQFVSNGVSLDGAVPALEVQLMRPRYPAAGWTHGLDMIAANDLSGESPQEDAAWCLAHHHARAGDGEAIEALAMNAVHGVVRGLHLGLRAATSVMELDASNPLVGLQESLRCHLDLPDVSQR